MADQILNSLLHIPSQALIVLQQLPANVLLQVHHIEHLIQHMSWEAVVTQIHVLADMMKNINYSSLVQAVLDCNTTAQLYMPTIRHVLFQIFDGIFAPKQLMKQLTLALVLQLGVSGIHWLSYFVHYSYLLMTTKGRHVLSATHRLNEAKTFKQWKLIAEELDHLNGK
jgi:hypothetical protein